MTSNFPNPWMEINQKPVAARKKRKTDNSIIREIHQAVTNARGVRRTDDTEADLKRLEADNARLRAALQRIVDLDENDSLENPEGIARAALNGEKE